MLLGQQFVLLDHVQFTDGGWQNRNYILGVGSECRSRLTLPVMKKGRFGQALMDVKLADPLTPRRHWKAIVQRYSKAPYFGRYSDELRAVLDREWWDLAELCETFIAFAMSSLDISVRMVRSSAIGLTSRRTAALADLCQIHGCDAVVTGNGAAHYLDVDLLAVRGIVHQPDGFRHPVYPQVVPGFVSHLSVIDLLFHTGPDARRLLEASVVRPRTEAG